MANRPTYFADLAGGVVTVNFGMDVSTYYEDPRELTFAAIVALVDGYAHGIGDNVDGVLQAVSENLDSPDAGRAPMADDVTSFRDTARRIDAIVAELIADWPRKSRVDDGREVTAIEDALGYLEVPEVFALGTAVGEAVADLWGRESTPASFYHELNELMRTEAGAARARELVAPLIVFAKSAVSLAGPLATLSPRTLAGILAGFEDAFAQDVPTGPPCDNCGAVEAHHPHTVDDLTCSDFEHAGGAR